MSTSFCGLLRKRTNLEADQQRLSSLCSHCAGCRELAEECEATECAAYFSRARVGLLWERARDLETWWSYGLVRIFKLFGNISMRGSWMALLKSSKADN